MSKIVWHKGPPPSVGWWPASRYQNITMLRWWDGQRWSAPAVAGMSALDAVRYMRMSAAGSTPIEWTDRPADWP